MSNKRGVRSTRPYELPTAAWSTDRLMTSLARAGYGDLAGREWQGVRSTLRALVDLLPWRSGSGHATSFDVAVSAGLSHKWVCRCLHILEDLGVITWRRGGVAIANKSDRRGYTGYFIIAKRRLVELVLAARAVNDRRYDEHRKATAERIAAIRHTKYTRTMLRNQNRRSQPVELSAHPASPTEGTGAASRPVRPDVRLQAPQDAPAARDLRAPAAPEPPSQAVTAALAAIRQTLARSRAAIRR